MPAPLISQHSRERAESRYRLELTSDVLDAIEEHVCLEDSIAHRGPDCALYRVPLHLTGLHETAIWLI